VSLVFPVTEVLAIEDHKLNSIFLHVAFGSQSLLMQTSDQPALVPIEVPEKATRGGGGEWEPIKIPRGNLVYIPNRTRRPSLLTQPRPHSYRKAIGPQNWVRNRSGNTNRCQQDHVLDRQQKSDRRTVYIFIGISPNT
jgi:hypothetical protein